MFLRVVHENRAMVVYPRIEEKSGEKSGRDKDNGEFVAHEEHCARQHARGKGRRTERLGDQETAGGRRPETGRRGDQKD
jgi:hypothetical protein